MSERDKGSIAPEHAARLERQEADRAGGNGVGNLLAAIDKNVAGEIAAKKKERDGYIEKVRALTADIVRLETHALIGVDSSGEPS